jgi:hypothetical protein
MPVSGSVLLLYAGAHKISLKYLFPAKMLAYTLKWENYLNSLSNKTVTISLDCQQNKNYTRA